MRLFSLIFLVKSNYAIHALSIQDFFLEEVHSAFYFLPIPNAVDSDMETEPPKGPIGITCPKPCPFANKLPVAWPTPAAFPPDGFGTTAPGATPSGLSPWPA